jgi:hypothetical protein
MQAVPRLATASPTGGQLLDLALCFADYAAKSFGLCPGGNPGYLASFKSLEQKPRLLLAVRHPLPQGGNLCFRALLGRRPNTGIRFFRGIRLDWHLSSAKLFVGWAWTNAERQFGSSRRSAE